MKNYCNVFSVYVFMSLCTRMHAHIKMDDDLYSIIM